MSRWIVVLAFVCVLQAGALLYLAARSREPAPPSAPLAASAVDVRDILQRIERRLDERLGAAVPARGEHAMREPAPLPARTPALDEMAAQIEELRQLTSTFAKVARTLADHEGATPDGGEGSVRFHVVSGVAVHCEGRL